MQIGNVLQGGGGKALKSDLIQKKLEFFKNLSEHVQLIGSRKILHASVQTSATDEFYTVPQRKLYFLFGIFMADRNTAGNQRANVSIKGYGTNYLLALVNRDNTVNNINIVYPVPIILKAGEALYLHKSNTYSEHECNATVVGYEVDAEVAG